MKNPWLTLITVTKDDPVGLARTLAGSAVWRQHPGVEQIVVHAGREPACLPESIRSVAQDGAGIAAAFNVGLREARGEWLWFINGGDAIHEELAPFWLEDWLRRTRADLVVGCIHPDGEEAPRAVAPLRDQWPLLYSWPPHPATLVRRVVLERVGGFATRYQACMDFDLWQRLLGEGAVADVVAVPLARFDQRGFSNRPENVGVLFRENGAVLWHHQGTVWRAAGRGVAGLMIAWLRALRHIFTRVE